MWELDRVGLRVFAAEVVAAVVAVAAAVVVVVAVVVVAAAVGPELAAPQAAFGVFFGVVAFGHPFPGCEGYTEVAAGPTGECLVVAAAAAGGAAAQDFEGAC